jgi:two-component SAPR family response regulator
MPGMTGLDLATQIKKIRPMMPIIIATGYAELPVNAPLSFLRLNKPYTQQQLSEAPGKCKTSARDRKVKGARLD